MESKRVISGFILALALVSCQGAVEKAPAPDSQSDAIKTGIGGLIDAETIRNGNFENAERPTSGNVKVIHSDKKYQVVFGDTFKTWKGPDLQVVLHRSSNLIPELSPPNFPLNPSNYVVVGNLKSIKGEQAYSLPSDIDIQDYGSIAIWCKKFNATFGAANLN